MIKSVFITAYKREKIFFNTINKLKLCKNYKEFKKLVIFQDVNKNILNKINKNNPEVKVFKTQYSKDLSPIYKINNNSYLGFKTCFENYKSDYVICLEDDVLPAYDLLKFHHDLIMRYENNKNFFAVNSFSREHKNILDKQDDLDINFAYSKYIYGVGKGWSISKKNWPVLKKMYKEVLTYQPNIAYDVWFDKEIKTKYFVIMPYRSRCLEQPSEGMHSKLKDVNSAHWKNWKISFMDKKEYRLKEYKFLQNMRYSWREDCLNYTLINMIKIRVKHIKFIMLKIIKNIIGQKKYFFIRKYIKNSLFNFN